MTYFINDTIPFKFKVLAVAEPVSLDVSKKVLKFSFPDDCTEMFITENIVITNTGEMTAQLISRTWNVNDANGLHEKVRGLGVVAVPPDRMVALRLEVVLELVCHGLEVAVRGHHNGAAGVGPARLALEVVKPRL